MKKIDLITILKQYKEYLLNIKENNMIKQNSGKVLVKKDI